MRKLSRRDFLKLSGVAGTTLIGGYAQNRMYSGVKPVARFVYLFVKRQYFYTYIFFICPRQLSYWLQAPVCKNKRVSG